MAARGDKNGIKAYASRINKKNRSNRLPFHPDAVRLKIQAIRLVQVLQDFIFGTVDKDGIKNADLSSTQVTAILGLLRKCVPDLVNTAITTDINVRYVAHLPEPISREAWLQKYGGDYLNPGSPPIIDGTTNGSGGNGEGGPLQ